MLKKRGSPSDAEGSASVRTTKNHAADGTLRSWNIDLRLRRNCESVLPNVGDNSDNFAQR